MAVNIKKNIFCIIDANINRAKEGLRVIEDIIRFVHKSKTSLVKIKNIRHAIDDISFLLVPSYKTLLNNRDSMSDAGRKLNNKGEFKRGKFSDVLVSNFKRVEESLRVLEEISKILNKKSALRFKNLRYEIYELEKKTILKT